MPDQGCSLVVGKGWARQEEDKSTVLLARGENGSEANVIVSTWATDSSVQNFVSEASAAMVERKFTVSKPEPFSTFSKVEGLRLKAISPDGGRIGVQYVFPVVDGRLLTLTGTFDREKNADFEKTLDLCMKTLHLLHQPHALPAELGNRFGDKRANLRIPLGWDTRADVTETVAFGPPVIQHNEHLFVSLERSAVPLREFVRSEVESQGPAGMSTDVPEDFKTTEAGQGMKVKGRLSTEGRPDMRTATYYFDGIEGLKIVIGASANAEHWSALEKLFDDCVRSLKIGE